MCVCVCVLCLLIGSAYNRDPTGKQNAELSTFTQKFGVVSEAIKQKVCVALISFPTM